MISQWLVSFSSSNGVVGLSVVFVEASELFDEVIEDFGVVLLFVSGLCEGCSVVIAFVSGSYGGVTDGGVIGRFRDDWLFGCHISNLPSLC